PFSIPTRDASPPLVLAFFGSTFLANKNDPKNGLAFDANVEHPAQKVISSRQTRISYYETP
ncbi:hypothetical protein, partial [Prevotellamassilia timonensis]|uniref:hypothetical protein n=1 Tax=Prevotellamassilia timonensis TaxID=1852370 RepID=UPI003FEF3F8B